MKQRHRKHQRPVRAMRTALLMTQRWVYRADQDRRRLKRLRNRARRYYDGLQWSRRDRMVMWGRQHGKATLFNEIRASARHPGVEVSPGRFWMPPPDWDGKETPLENMMRTGCARFDEIAVAPGFTCTIGVDLARSG